MGVAAVRRLKPLEVEDAKLKRLVGCALDAYRVTERRACRVLCTSRATLRYGSVDPGQEELRMRPRLQSLGDRGGAPELGLAADPRAAASRWLAGQPQAHGAALCMAGLNLRRNRARRRKSVVTRGPSVVPMRRDERWSSDFMHDQLHDGRRLRVLTWSTSSRARRWRRRRAARSPRTT